MKAVALILALAVISGCHARAVRQARDEPAANQWEENVDRFWNYFLQINSMANGVVDSVKGSQLARELDTLITDTMAELTTYKEDIETKLGPLAGETAAKLSEDMKLLTEKLQADMLSAKEQGTEYLGEIKTMVEQNVEDVRNRISSYTRKLKKRLSKHADEIRNTAATYLDEVQSRASQHVDMVKEKVEPFVTQAHETASETLNGFSALLRSQSENLAQQLESQAQGLKSQLENTAQEIRTTLEGKMDMLNDWLTPFTNKLREQLQAVMDKIKETSA